MNDNAKPYTEVVACRWYNSTTGSDELGWEHSFFCYEPSRGDYVMKGRRYSRRYSDQYVHYQDSIDVGHGVVYGTKVVPKPHLRKAKEENDESDEDDDDDDVFE